MTPKSITPDSSFAAKLLDMYPASDDKEQGPQEQPLVSVGNVGIAQGRPIPQQGMPASNQPVEKAENHSQEHSRIRVVEGSSGGVSSLFGGQRDVQVSVNQGFPKGFSDDEDEDIQNVFDRSFPGIRYNASPMRRQYELSEEEEMVETIDRLAPGVKQTKSPKCSLKDVNKTDTNDDASPGQQHCSDWRLGGLKDGEDSSTDCLVPGEGIPSDQFQKVVDGKGYELRKNLDRQIKGTYLDQDQSENYDPEKERKREVQLSKQRKARKKAKVMPNPHIPKFIVKLGFSRFGTVRNITDEKQNWPENWSELDEQNAHEAQAREERSRLRAQKIMVRTRKSNMPILDPKPDSGIDDLTGHPAARGCVGCRIYGQRCSMLDGDTWPCNQCSENAINCRLIMYPQGLARCNRCDEHSHNCSFESWRGEGLNDMPPKHCDECLQAGIPECESGPPAQYKHKRIDLNALMYGPGRSGLQCNHCVLNGRRCSLKRKFDKGPCNQCKKIKVKDLKYPKDPAGHVACTFYPLTTDLAEGSKVEEKREGMVPTGHGQFEEAKTCTEADLATLEEDDNEEVESSDLDPITSFENDLEYKTEDFAGHKGVVTKITTSFAHPINFNWLQMGGSCTFCESPLHGFVGWNERSEVWVLKWDDGCGYTELQGGHGATYPADTMCPECATSRLQIILCSGHQISRYREASELCTWESALAQMLPEGEVSGEPDVDQYIPGLQEQLRRWCSMCFSLATFKCCASPDDFEAYSSPQSKGTEGCGLRLCELCERILREEYKGNFEEMILVLQKRPKLKSTRRGRSAVVLEGVVRADVEFLSKEGLLHKNAQVLFGGEIQ